MEKRSRCGKGNGICDAMCRQNGIIETVEMEMWKWKCGNGHVEMDMWKWKCGNVCQCVCVCPTLDKGFFHHHHSTSRGVQHLWSTARNEATTTDGKGSRTLDPVPAE